MCVAILFPLELATGFLQKFATFLSTSFVNVGGIKFTSPIKTATKPTINFIKHFFTDSISLPNNLAYTLILIISIVMLYFALFFIVKLMKSLVINRTESALDSVIGKNGLIGIFAGLLFTIIVQSSSITTSLLIPLIGAGLITDETIFPITMGANIGTTATAILASFATGNPAAITIAFVHFLFNVIGVVFIYPIKVMRAIPINLAKHLGDLAFKKRRYALMYVFGVFFLVPGLLIVVSKLLK
jgi:sodium-dependent phosphate cotransporter